MNEWLQTITVLEVLGVLGAIGLFLGSIKWVWPLISGVKSFLSDWMGEPARPGVDPRPGVPARLKDLDDAVRKNMDDVATLLEVFEGLVSLHAEIESLSEKIAEFQGAVKDSIEDRANLWVEARKLHNETNKLSARITALEELAIEYTRKEVE